MDLRPPAGSARAAAEAARWRRLSRACTVLVAGSVGAVSLALMFAPGAVIASYGVPEQDSATLRMALGGWGWGHLLLACGIAGTTWRPERREALWGWLVALLINAGGLANTVLRGAQLPSEAHAGNFVMDAVLFAACVTGIVAHARLERR